MSALSRVTGPVGPNASLVDQPAVVRRVAGADVQVESTVAPVRAPRPPARRPAHPLDVLTPNVLLPGVSHAGVRALARALGRHPQVCLPGTSRIDLFTPLRYGQAMQGSAADYSRHFASWTGQRFRLEASPVCFDGGARLGGAIDKVLPDVRIVVVLRDPADRLWTGYCDKLARGRLPRAMSYDAFVDRCLGLRANGADRFEANRHYRTLSGGFYADHLPGWMDVFGSRLRVVFTEDLDDDPAPPVAALFTWLGLDPAEATEDSRARRASAIGGAGAGAEADPEGGERAGALSRVFNPRFWSHRGDVHRRCPPGPLLRAPRQSERARARVKALYEPANAELARVLAERGYTDLPTWLGDPATRDPASRGTL